MNPNEESQEQISPAAAYSCFKTQPGEIFITVPTPWNGLKEPHIEWQGGRFALVAASLVHDVDALIAAHAPFAVRWLGQAPWPYLGYVIVMRENLLCSAG